MYRLLAPDDVTVIVCSASRWQGRVGETSGQFAYGRITNYPYLSVDTDGKVTNVDAPVEITDRGWELLHDSLDGLGWEYVGTGMCGLLLSDFCAMAFYHPDKSPVGIDVGDDGRVVFKYKGFNHSTGEFDKVETEHVANLQQD